LDKQRSVKFSKAAANFKVSGEVSSNIPIKAVKIHENYAKLYKKQQKN
jgi:hypothetical protein